MERSWPYVDILRRSLSWLFGGTVVRSILGPLALLAGYGVVHRFLIRRRWFIVVSEFRVWGKLVEKFPEKGVAARLGDELMRLWKQMRLPDIQQSLDDAGYETASSLDGDASEATERLGLYDAKGFSLPETPVTLQYKGISIEGLHTFVRRFAKREVVLTGDLLSRPPGVVITVRATDCGPWEVQTTGSGSAALEAGLQRLALKIMTTLTEKFQPTAANAFVMLQDKAISLKEFDLALRLARVGLRIARDSKREVDLAKRNLATAHNERGIERAEKASKAKTKDYGKALLDFRVAYGLDSSFCEARDNFIQDAGKVEEKTLNEVLRTADEIVMMYSQ